MDYKILAHNRLYEYVQSNKTPKEPHLCVSYDNFNKLNTENGWNLTLNNEARYKTNGKRLVSEPDLHLSVIYWESDDSSITYSVNTESDMSHPRDTNSIKLHKVNGEWEAYDTTNRSMPSSEHESIGGGDKLYDECFSNRNQE